MYKKYAVLAAVLLISAVGCGKTDDQGSSGETETTSQTEEVTEDAAVTETALPEETSETQTTSAVTTAEPVTDAAQTEKELPLVNEKNVLHSMKIGMTEEEALSEFGIENGIKFEGSHENADYEYDYIMTCDNVFGTGLKGYMFAQFDSSSQKLICCGYHLGRIISDGTNIFPYSEDELREAYSKITLQLADEFGEGTRPETIFGEGIREELTWEDGTEHIWSVYGIDLWSENSGINEIVVSRSVDR